MPVDFGQFLTWLGTEAAIGAVISFIYFNWRWFQNRQSGEKVTILVATALVMGIGSHILTTYVPAGVVAELQPYYKAIVSSLVILFGSRAWHEWVNKRPPDPVPLSATTAEKNIPAALPVLEVSKAAG